ncbi:MAG: prolipoprotein diacylglyceryl transferase [Paracoccaceae bacterium]|nr:MAG: prolipoprotein diacylglyceryl transferase [Paracoccaceae bacterium]
MSAYLSFPRIDPAVFSIELFGVTLSLRWYALAYIAGLLGGWRGVVFLMRRPGLWPGSVPPMTPDAPERLLSWMVLGVVAGGRLGYALFYAPGHFLSDPLAVLRLWEGGMSFHGGFLGVIVATVLWCRATGAPLLQVADAVACVAPLGLMLGRLANFINGELWGRPTLQPWGMVFPGAAAQTCPPGWPDPVCARHPSQLYEAAAEGLLLLVVMWVLALRFGWLRHPGRLTGMFFLGYGLARSLIENFRQGDAQFVTADNPWGHVIRLGHGAEAWGLTMGQVLSLPMILIGIGFLIHAARRERGA